MAAYKLHEKFVDPAAGHISSYFCQLFILTGKDYFQYVLLDTDKNKFLALADYRTPADLRKTGPNFDLIRDLIENEDFLKKSYPSVSVGTDNPFHTLVPASLFNSVESEKYLRFNFNIPSGYKVISDKIDESDAMNISAIPEEVKEIFASKYDKAIFFHRSTAILKAASHHHAVNPSDIRLFIVEKGKMIDLVLFEGDKPLLFNSFSFKGREDVLYFTLNVLEQAAVKPENVALSLGGVMDEMSDSYRLLSQYFSKISFTPRPDNFSYSAIFNHIPPQRYLDLFAMALCGS